MTTPDARRWIAHAGLALVIVGGACGTPGNEPNSPSPASSPNATLGAVTSEQFEYLTPCRHGDRVEKLSTAQLMRSSVGVIELSVAPGPPERGSPSTVEGFPEASHYTLIRGIDYRVRSGEVPDTINITAYSLTRAASVAGPDVMILAGAPRPRFTESGDLRPMFTQFVAVIDSTDAIVLIDDCNDFNEALRAFRDSDPPIDGEGAAALIIGLVDATSGERAAFDAWVASLDPNDDPSWVDLAPRDRALDLEHTLQSVFDGLSEGAVRLHMDRSWLELGPYTVCTYIPDLSWAWCNLITAGSPDPTSLLVHVQADAGLEFWILNESARLAAPVAFLGRVDEATASGFTDTARELDIHVAPMPPLEELLDPTNDLVTVTE